MTQELRDGPETTDDVTAAGQRGDRITPLEYLVMAACLIGIIVALILVLDHSDIPLFDGHAAEVVADFWNRNATIGLLVVSVTVVAVSLFVWFLAKSTLGSDPDGYQSGDDDGTDH